MQVFCIKIDDKYDQFVEELTEEQKEKLNQILSNEANLLITAMLHTPPEMRDQWLKTFINFYKKMANMMDDPDWL